MQEGYGTHEQEALADTGPDISPTSALDAVTPPPLPRVEPGAGACGPQAAPRPVVRRQSWRRPRPAPLLLLLLLSSVVRPTRLPARRRSRPLLLPALHASTPPLPSPSPSNQRAPILIAREAPHGLGSKGVRQQWDSKPHAQPPLRLAPVLHPLPPAATRRTLACSSHGCPPRRQAPSHDQRMRGRPCAYVCGASE